MHERIRSSYQQNGNKTTTMGPDIGPKKTMIVVVIVVGCFAVLWPKVFQPMLFGVSDDYIKPNAADRSKGCCDVYAEKDINTIKMLSELCSHIVEAKGGTNVRNPRAVVAQCREEVLAACGIDISAILEERVRLGISVKRLINEVRSLNGSLCLKYNFGVAPSSIGVPHQITSQFKATSVRQERPPQLRPEMMHPAFRERGSNIAPGAPMERRGPPPRIVEGRPGPIPGMRPPMGGAGGVVPPSQKGSSMGIIMPIYTIGIVIFFTYTLMKLLFKKQSDNVDGLYPHVEPDKNFRRDVFESQAQLLTSAGRHENNSKIVVNAMSALLDEVDEELEARRKAAEQLAEKETIDEENEDDNENAQVKVLGMETTASCEGGQKWSSRESPIQRPATPPLEISEPPQEIFLEGALPANTKILVSDAKTEAQTESVENDPAVVLAGKMTLSVIGVADAFETEKKDGDEEIEVESKYTTVSALTAAEKEDVEDDVLGEENDEGNNTDNEEIEDLGEDDQQ